MGKHLTHTPALFSEIGSYVRYNPADGSFVWIRNTGYTKKVGKAAGRVTSRGYVRIQFGGVDYPAHQIAWYLIYGTLPLGKVIDHINGDRADNRIANLRLATISENGRNRKRNAGKRLPKGVTFDPRYNRYRAAIKIDGAKINLGSHPTVEDAAAAYAKAAVTVHGTFARIA